MCDLAEVYHIYDYRSLPASRVATFAVGLRNNSRIKEKLRGDDLKGNTQTEIQLAMLCDILMRLMGGDAPSMVNAMLGTAEREKKETKESGFRAFGSPEDYEAARRAIIGG